MWGCTQRLEARLKKPPLFSVGADSIQKCAPASAFSAACPYPGASPGLSCAHSSAHGTNHSPHPPAKAVRTFIQLRFAFVTRADPQPVSRSLSNTTCKVSPTSRCTRCQPCRVQRFPRFSTTSAFSPLAPFFNSSGRSPASPCARWGCTQVFGGPRFQNGSLTLEECHRHWLTGSVNRQRHHAPQATSWVASSV